MEGGINKLEYNTKIGINKITANFMTTLNPERILKPEEIEKIIIKEFSPDFDLWTNGRLILGELSPYCYEVLISPQLKGRKSSYTMTVKK